MKKLTLTAWKKKVWAQVSIYVRTQELDKSGRATCFTCNLKKKWKKMYAGHFVQGRRPSILFILEIIRVQCVGCNRFRHGNLNRFIPKMVHQYGIEQILIWFKMAEMKVEYDQSHYENLFNKFYTLNKSRGFVK